MAEIRSRAWEENNNNNNKERIKKKKKYTEYVGKGETHTTVQIFH